MRILLLIFCALFISKSSTEKVFEGELIYHHDMKINSKNYSESRKYYDTLTVTYKNKNYIKLTNKKNYEKILFIDSLRKIYVIYKDNLNKSKNLSMNEDNLNFGKLYNRENSHFGKIVSLSKSDTILSFDKIECNLKKLLVEREYGNETYIYSDYNDLKLTDNRNILRNIGEQIHPEQIASELKNSILYYYKLEVKNTDLYEEYKLVKINNKKINDSVFEIPEHKDAKGYKKENRKKGRFKFYELTK
ncbi:hypothetical protein [Seonamhaeicola maritimus]|uniref:hypothetical protein n=1 Tax=Seonamhaeicola maritimus TaxID=2591822 RepID=UPI0024954753|nr:hypothetical protein [Seonamhaeicola maritimus]